VIVVIDGPIASGKSTVAKRVSSELSRRGMRTAVIDLDEVHDTIEQSASGSQTDRWADARRAAGRLAAAFAEDGVTAVIVEGSLGSPDQREELLTAFATRDALFVSLRVSYAEALRRVHMDPTRGLSRDETFLAAYFADRAGQALADSDLSIDTEQVSEDRAAALIADAVVLGLRA
jgi:cytidylate kinase